MRVGLPLDVSHSQVAFLLQGHIDFLVLGGFATGAEEPASGCGLALLVLVGELDLLHV